MSEEPPEPEGSSYGEIINRVYLWVTDQNNAVPSQIVFDIGMLMGMASHARKEGIADEQE
jgi:hypothetical protein